jgi:hypothetical protein
MADGAGSGCSLCDSCPLRAVLLLGLPRPAVVRPNPRSGGGRGPRALGRMHFPRLKAIAPRRCCMGFRQFNDENSGEGVGRCAESVPTHQNWGTLSLTGRNGAGGLRHYRAVLNEPPANRAEVPEIDS